MTTSADRSGAASPVQEHFPGTLFENVDGRLATLRSCLLLLLAVSTVGVLVWAAGLLLRQPYSGLNWSYTTGVVQSVDARGPAAGLFQPGESIAAVNGLPVYEARGLPGLRPGDTATFTVVHSGIESSTQLRLVVPPAPVLLERLSVIPIALSFWLLGALVLAFGSAGGLVTLFFLFCQAIAAALGLGAVSAFGPLWSGWAFNLLFWWIAPLALHTHLLLADWPSARRHVRFILYLYAFTLILSLIDLWRLSTATLGFLVIFKPIWVGLALLASAAVLAGTFLRGRSLPSRRKTGVAALSASLAFLPLVLFSLIPGGLFGRPLLPYSVTLLALPALPLGYAYAIGRHRLLRIERYVNRSIAYALAALVAGTIYALLYFFYRRFAGGREWIVTPLGFAATTLLIIAVPLIYRGLQRVTDGVFYGRWYDDGAAVKHVSQSVAGARGDAAGIGSALCLALLKVLRLEDVSVLLGNGSLVTASGRSSSPHHENWGPARAATIISVLCEDDGQMIGRGHELRALLPLSVAERKQLLGNRPQLWLLIGTCERPQGLLVLGAKRGSRNLAPRDLEILEVVARQAGAALENEFLLAEVRRHSAQLRRLHRQIVQAREEERKRVARDLHDNTIQALVGLNYQLAHARRDTGGERVQYLAALQQQVRDILREVRQVCAGLRPPALDSLGLVPTLESHVAEIRAQAPFHVRLQTADLEEPEIPDAVALVLYRFLQEALLNVRKHAAARLVTVRLQDDAGKALVLTVADDGRGFRPPRTLSALAQERHFGLIGLQEQVEGVGGTMRIRSAPGEGCALTAIVPLRDPDPAPAGPPHELAPNSQSLGSGESQ